MENENPKILILGVGNILFTDEGVGVRVVEYLMENYEFSENVELMDGGTLGMRLMGPIMDVDRLVVVDAVHGGDEPGTMYRLTDDDMRKSLAFKGSMHDVDLVETLLQCDLAGHRPEAVVIGVEPYDLSTMGIEVSPQVKEKMPYMATFVLDEIARLGGTFKPKQ